MKKRVWLTWEHQTRNLSMATLLECDYVEFYSKSNLIIRYLTLSFKTLQLLLSRKPTEIFFQNPSIVLACVCLIYKLFNRNLVLVGDFHNAALEKSKLSFVNSLISKRINLTIVSNSRLIDRVKEMGGTPFVMPDPIPNIKAKSNNTHTHNYLTFICSWANDEPINTVLQAFIESDVYDTHQLHLYVTGRVKPARLEQDRTFYELKGVKFLGFVDESTYVDLIANSIANIDLTTRPDCLVCGAYESIALGSPVILSGNEATRAYFGDYCHYTDNSVSDLKNRIVEMIQNPAHFKTVSMNARNHFIESDRIKKQQLESYLATYSRAAKDV